MSGQGTSVRVGVDLRQFRKGMRDVKDGLNELTRPAAQVAAAISGSLKAIGFAALRTGEEFNNSLNSMQTQTGWTRDETVAFGKDVRRMALDSRWSANELMSASASVAMYGRTQEESMRMLSVAQAHATATGGDLETSMHSLSAISMKLDLDYTEMYGTMNMMFEANRRFGISTETLTSAIQDGNSVRQAFGLSYNFIATAMSGAYREGASLSKVNTGLRNIMEEMIQPASGVRRGMEKLGLQVSKNDDGTIDYQTSMIALARAMEDADPVLAEQVTATMGLNGAQTEALGTLRALSDNWDDYYDTLNDAWKATYDMGGAMTYAGGIMSGGFGDAINKVRGLIQELLLRINDIIGSRIYEWVTEAAQGFRDFMESADGEELLSNLAEAIMSIVESLIEMIKAIMPIVIEWLPKLVEWTTTVIKVVSENIEVVLGLWAAFKGYKIVSSVIGIFGGLKTAAAVLKGKKAVGGLAPAMGKAVGAKSGGGMLGGGGKLLKALGPKGWAVAGVVGGTVAVIRGVGNQRKAMEKDYDSMYATTGDKTAAMAYAAATNMGRMSEQSQEKLTELMKEHASRFDEIYQETGDKTKAMSAVTSLHFGQLKDDAIAELSKLESKQARLYAEMEATTCESTREQLRVQKTNVEQMRIEAVNTLKQLERDYDYYGEALPQGMQTGLDRGQLNAFSAIGDFARGIGERFKNFFGINSPSREFIKYGSAMTQGAERGIGRGERSAVSRIGSLASNMLSRFRSTMEINSPSRLFSNYGQNITQGLTNGIERGESGAISRIGSLASNMLSRFRSDMEINSPSRLFHYFGEMTIEGYRGGMSDVMKDVMKDLQGYAKDISSCFDGVDLALSTPNYDTYFPSSAQMMNMSGVISRNSNSSQPIVIHNTYEVYNNTDVELINREQEQMIRDVMRSRGEAGV